MRIKIEVRHGTFKECVTLSNQIPEFDNPYYLEEYEKRCGEIHLILITEIKGKPIGFKIGYDRYKEGSFYSWMGGVLPEFRQNGIANALADYQENWAKENGFGSIKLKTRNKHKAMIQFSLKRGFVIQEEIPKTPNEETRILMVKDID